MTSLPEFRQTFGYSTLLETLAPKWTAPRERAWSTPSRNSYFHCVPFCSSHKGFLKINDCATTRFSLKSDRFSKAKNFKVKMIQTDTVMTNC